MYNSQILNIEKFKGINKKYDASRIEDTECVDMFNMEITEGGVLSKRKGFKTYMKIDGINNFIEHITPKVKLGIVYTTGSGIFCKSLYSAPIQIQQTTVKFDTNAIFFFNGKLYILDGETFWELDTSGNQPVCVRVDSKAYVPTILITCNPATGSGSEYEQMNMISSHFKQSYNGDGSTKLFYCAIPTNLTITKVMVDNVVIANTSYSLKTDAAATGYVGKPKSYVEFITAPSKGIDNVIIEYELNGWYLTETDFSDAIYREFALNKARINSSFIYSTYGGQNDTRLLLAGKDSVFCRSDVFNPYYFPENYYQSVGDTYEKITGFVTQYDYCVIIKEHSIWYTRFDLDSKGNPLYLTKPLNEQFGSPYKGSIQVIDNNPIFLDKYKGICVIKQTTIRDERNVECISERINSLLLPSIKSSSIIRSFDYKGRYYLSIDNRLFIYDYINDLFYIWGTPYSNAANRVINGFGIIEDKMCMSMNSQIMHFDEIYSDKVYSEDLTVTGSYAYPCFWRSKMFNFNAENMYKLIERVYLMVKPSSKTSTVLKYSLGDNTATEIQPISLPTTYNNLMDYSTMAYDTMSYETSKFPIVTKYKIKLKKVIYLQFIIENNIADESLDIYGMDIKYKPMKFI